MDENLFLGLRISLAIIMLLLMIYGLRKFFKSKNYSKLLDRIDGSLRESSSETIWSLTRFLTLATAILSNIIFWFAFLFGSIIAGRILEIPDSVVFVYLSINGIQGLVKVFQKKYEA